MTSTTQNNYFSTDDALWWQVTCLPEDELNKLVSNYNREMAARGINLLYPFELSELERKHAAAFDYVKLLHKRSLQACCSHIYNDNSIESISYGNTRLTCTLCGKVKIV